MIDLNDKDIYYIKGKKFGLVIDGNAQTILAVIKGRADKHFSDVRIVEELRLADHSKRTHFDRQKAILFVDGLALIDLLVWAVEQRDWKDGRQFFKSFQRLFGGGDGIRIDSYPTASLAAAGGMAVPGELDHIKAEFIRQHPDAFAALQHREPSVLLEIDVSD
ncbi:hypothetical protein HNR59_002017 [Aquamicrobium lusatiense]|uniref:Uncharacterized protein n=1 Tax=Aquamicrobium lusatiense TaxID=89772 RepID=A0A7W9S220_9HYPH|nr:hypothetical protein [Aquamicrobium lusatiense]MBB6012672.1 hypothetical protein [Aquamicrobium lusatiense]